MTIRGSRRRGLVGPPSTIEDSTGSTCARSRACRSCREEEVVLAKAIELGLRIRTEPWTALLDLMSGIARDRGDSRGSTPSTRCPTATTPLASSARRSATTAAGDLLTTAPRFGFHGGVSSAATDATREMLGRARDLVPSTTMRLDAESFLNCSTGQRRSL